jgi:putative transposase
VIYAFIETHQEHAVVKWAQYFGVSTSGYYDWVRDRRDRNARYQAYGDEVESIFHDSHNTYGAERIGAVLRQRGHRASFRKVKRIMRERGLRSVHVKRVKALTDSRKARGDGYENLLQGREITKPFEALSSDISYIPTDEGFDYLCQVKDITTGIILASCQQERMTQQLVIDTIRAALKRWRLPQGCIFHSDRGSQYTSKEVMALLAKRGIRQSFSRVGMPGDNPWSESFFSILKKEAVHPLRFHSRDQARQAIFLYIETFYNRTRIQKKLGFRPPIDFLRITQLHAA